ncbi:peptidase T [Peptoniphilus sp. oral taxon 386]|uniref:peptidase T n=1 Tax=Peptoniphilus sp. oral taxon 386 TaxID=652713 RepID=UPI0001DA9B8D|nr:peptidase T [Peptoniphilus sp. oral taxon 386]EFI42144.1 peptidase T [Peptoniphilus sp. oral taxon 386 str. F0131]
MKDIVERFLKYVSFETTSDDSSETCPSTENQLVLAKYLVEELTNIGMKEVTMDKNGYVYATLPSNTNKNVPTVGFIAHMDTAPDLTGKNVNPKFVDYKGGDIKLNDEYVMTEKEFPFLKNLIGERLITTDGTTLLGADDKSGIAIIVSAMEYLIENPSIKHGTVKVGFTPDEEIGRGANLFDVKNFAADFAYTIDGGPVGELEYENFNAASVEITIKGKNVHPGSAKNIMLNSSLIGIEINSLLPSAQRPEHTEGYEGFFLLDEFNGTVEETKMFYIIRDHDIELFNKKKELITNIVEFINKKYGNVAIINISDSYFNMKEKIEPHMEIIELASKSMKDLNIEPIIQPIRGGTDGATLSYMGLPCPNLFAGGYNFHGRYEFIPVSSLTKGKDLVIKIIENLEAK